MQTDPVWKMIGKQQKKKNAQMDAARHLDISQAPLILICPAFGKA